MRLSIPTLSFFLLVLSSSRVPLLASPYVSHCGIFDYSPSYVEAAYKGRDAMRVCQYNAKGTAAEGSEKASEAWETTKGKAREAAEGSEKAAEARETTKDKAR